MINTTTTEAHPAPKQHVPLRYREAQPLPVTLRPAVATLGNGATMHRADDGWLVRRPDGTREVYGSVAQAMIENA